MKILVCINHVPDTTAKIDFESDNQTLKKEGVQFVINPYDEFCLARAMWFKEKDGAHITVAHVGTSDAEPSLRKALAIGADDAIRINTDAKDGFTVAKALAEIITKKAYDLILAGKESADYNGGMVPGILAGILDYPFVNACTELEKNDANLTATRETDDGQEILKIKMPCVIAGQKGLVEEKDLRIPNMRGIMTARKKAIEIVTTEHTPSKTNTAYFEKPPEKEGCKILGADEIDTLAEILLENSK